AVGKVFKPDLRRHAISRVYNAALETGGVSARVVSVTDDKKRGLVAQLDRPTDTDEATISAILGAYTRPWEWAT
ncbi:MAG: hypothetical protein ABJ349_11175, partial [Hyphomicrobiales bacterium]